MEEKVLLICIAVVISIWLLKFGTNTRRNINDSL